MLALVVLGAALVLGRHSGSIPARPNAALPIKPTPGIRLLDPKHSRIDAAHIDARARALVGRPDMAGLAVAVVENGQLAFAKGYGETQAGKGEPVTAQTLFRWASVSKGVAATMTALLASQGKLSLDDPVARWSSIRLPAGGERVATLTDALSHRLGIVRNAYDDRLEGNEDPRQIRSELGKLEALCRLGTCFAYENVAFDLVHEAVEKATGQSYDAAAHRLLFGPLGMTSAGTTREELVAASSWARPHKGRTTLPVEEAYYRIPAAAGMNSSIVDLAIWMRAQMGGAPAVLSPALLLTLHRPRVSTPPHGRADRLAPHDVSYGLGFRQIDYAGHHLIGHRGAVRGYRSVLLFDPAEQVGVVMLWNSEASRPVGLSLEILDGYYRHPFHDWLQLDKP